VHVTDARTGRTVTQAGVSLYTTMLDMEMGTDTINLQPDGKGNFTALGDLGMAGRWQIRVVVRTADNQLHSASVTFSTSA
jgi:nitrogen fixation protein FixH